MQIKFFEIRDEATCIPVMAIKMKTHDEVSKLFLRRGGYPESGSAVILMDLSDQSASVDPYSWGGRTRPVAHNHIYDNFNKLKDGSVVDVRVLLGETRFAVISEIM